MAEGGLDELFLTLASQVATREDATTRPGLVAGHHFGPEQSFCGTLISEKGAGSLLCLRFAFAGEA
jgi:hypothetical protein